VTRVVLELPDGARADEDVGDVGAVTVAVGELVKVFNDWRLHVKAIWMRQ